MHKFHPVPGNMGFGLAVAASIDHVGFGIRTLYGQGDIISFKSRKDAEEIVKLLTEAINEAWPEEK